MNAKEALEKYGFEENEEGVYVRVLGDKIDLSTERWVEVQGGWRCYKVGSDWGKLDPKTGLHSVPFGQNEAFADVGGLHPETHPQCFEFVWPDERIVEIYEHAGEEGWTKVTDYGDDGQPSGYHMVKAKA